MNRSSLVVAVVTLAATLVACSSDEVSPHPVPVDAATDAARDGSPKADASSDHASPEGGAPEAAAKD